MRIIGGIAKGTHLRAPLGRRVRPTSDRVKEALFSILQFEIKDKVVLDLYAGTGSLGIEALSRGAEMAVFVEKDPLVFKFLRENLNRTGLGSSAKVYNLSVETFLNKLEREQGCFDLIFLDPPYKIKPQKLKIVVEKAANFLKKQGMMVVEHKTGLMIDYSEVTLLLADNRVYGDTALSFYKLLR